MPRLLLVLCFILFFKTSHACIKTLEAVAGVKAHEHKDLMKYISGMDKSSLQKAVFALLSRPGLVADLGSGSGITSHDLAIFMANSKVIGVDLDPNMVEYANKTYKRDNLSYQQGDAQKTNLESNSLDAVFMSSTGHHLTSYGKGAFDTKNVLKAFDEAVRILKDNGIYVSRDFVIPNGPEWVHIELPDNDGKQVGDPTELSTAALFEKKFAKDFRSSLHPNSGVQYKELNSEKAGWKKYRVRLRDAAEFVLRKDYKTSYDAEIKEEYTYFTQKEFEEEFNKRGLRILHSGPIFNPWIVANRYEGKFFITDENGKPIPFPPTNYVIVGQKIAKNSGMKIQEATSKVVKTPQFLTTTTMKNSETNELMDIIGRPNDTVEVLPFWEQEDGNIFVLAKQGFPRPLTQSLGKTTNLSNVKSNGYRVEPLSFLQDKSEPAFTALEKNLLARAGVSSDRILPGKQIKPISFYSSPGSVDEKIQNRSIEINPKGLHSVPHENYSGFSTSGDVRPFEANSILHSAQAGSILDARLELGVYNLLIAKKKPLGKWIGDTIELRDQTSDAKVKINRASTLLNPKNRQRVFTPSEKPANFLNVIEGNYVETSPEGKVVAKATREYIAPKNFSHNIVSTIAVYKENGKVYVGLEKRNLPAVQMHEGFSDIVTAPAFRLPQEIKNLQEANAFSFSALAKYHGVKAIKSWELGGPYNSSIGVTPETVYPRVVEVEKPKDNAQLHWVELNDLTKSRDLIKDGHSLVLVYRLAHALGYL